MLLKILQDVMRIETRIGIIEASHKAHGNNVVFRTVDPRTAIFFCRKRPAHGVDNLAFADAPRRNFPELLYSDAIYLRVTVLIEVEPPYKLLGQRAARALGKNRDLGFQFVTGLEIRFLLVVLVYALIVGADSHDPVLVKEQF